MEWRLGRSKGLIDCDGRRFNLVFEIKRCTIEFFKNQISDELTIAHKE
jgi:hypothetical protein